MDVTTIISVSMIVFLVLLWIVAFVKWLYKLSDERTYILNKLKRSETEKEKEHWQKKLQEFYICSIPFIGKWFKNRRI